MRKKLDNKNLLALGIELSKQLETAGNVWKLAMKVYPISSPEYKAICKSGRDIQCTYNKIELQAAEVLSATEVGKYFTNKTYYLFD